MGCGLNEPRVKRRGAVHAGKPMLIREQCLCSGVDGI